MTGGRIKRLEKYLKNERFLLTYGDGLCDVNLKNLIRFHEKNILSPSQQLDHQLDLEGLKFWK